uniref:Uncharacterized protein n=1 Tax=Aegilops tauschii subsp. strangulata TaxID=200361 RepID=A0A453HA99_AEGTS
HRRTGKQNLGHPNPGGNPSIPRSNPAHLPPPFPPAAGAAATAAPGRTMLLVSQAANGSLSARRLPSKPLASRRGANPYPLFAGPRVARRRLALSGAADARDAPRRASASPPAHAAAGEGPSGSPAAAEDPVLLGVSDDRVPLEGVIQVERPGQADAQSKLVSYAASGRRGSALPPDLLRDWEAQPWPARA